MDNPGLADISRRKKTLHADSRRWRAARLPLRVGNWRRTYHSTCRAVSLGELPHPPGAGRDLTREVALDHLDPGGIVTDGSPAMNEVTRVLTAIEHGEPQAAEQLLPLVYDELRKLATRRLAREATGQTLQATALVHEAYLRLVDTEQARQWNGRTHFFRAAAEAMRRILVDRARGKRSRKRGGGQRRVDLELAADVVEEASDDVVALDEALEEFARHDPAKAELVKLRYFAGLSVEEAAALLGISRATADRNWRYAKTWLYCAMTRRTRPEPE